MMLTMGMIVSLAACGSQPADLKLAGGDKISGTVELTADVSQAEEFLDGPYCPVGEYDSMKKLAVELLKKTAEISDEENLLLSPVSVMMALAMTAQGAEGETLAQMEQTFGKDTAFFSALIKGYCDDISNDNTAAKISVANSLWLRDDSQRLTVMEDFLAKNKILGAQIFKSPFDKTTVTDVNKWCSEHTGGMIDSIIDKIQQNEVIYLINALAYENQWQIQYDNNDVRGGDFTAADGSKTQVDFMFSSESTYLKDDNATGFIKPYKDGFNFVAIMPNEGVTIDEYLTGMDENTLDNLIAGGKEYSTVKAGLPKFKSEININLAEILKAMGMTDMFDYNKANFSNMAVSSEGNIYISKVSHKTFIQVDTEGTKAAAVTQVVACDEAAMEQEQVTLNRPFIYMIVDDSELQGLPLFMGTMERII